MNKYIIITCLAVTALLARPVYAESIQSFSSDIEIEENGIIDVVETIDYDFGGIQRHGIYREIPYVYPNGLTKTRTSIEVLDVTRDGEWSVYSVSRSGDNQEIKIGESDVLISGEHIYQIHYQVLGVINRFSDFDELYWNVTGNDWDQSMAATTVTIRWPHAIMTTDDVTLQCYRGELGSADPCPISVAADGTVTASAGALQPSEGFSIAVGFPKGLVADLTTWQQVQLLWLGSMDYLPLGLALILMPVLWFKFGRDPKGRPTIIAQYEPPLDLKPTLVGTLVDESVDSRDITAGVIWLAQQGWLKIDREEKKGILKNSIDYRLTLLKPGQALGTGIEDTLVRALFSGSDTTILLSAMKRDRVRGQLITSLKSLVYKELVVQKFYAHNPYYMKGTVMALAVILPIFTTISGLDIIPNLIAAVIIFVFGLKFGKKTKLGAETRDDILGFKLFLSVTDAERFKFHNAPEKNPQQFMQWLPYAIALGVEKQWAEQFKGIEIEAPSWYGGTGMHYLMASQFVADFGNFSGEMNRGFTAATHQSASGGGGFSGGGFGGGGGGSW